MLAMPAMLALAAIALPLSGDVRAQPPEDQLPPGVTIETPLPPDSYPQMPSAIKMLENGNIRLGAVEVDPKARAIRFDGEFNMKEGGLEYAIVAHHGKLHESLLRTAISPYDLQVALVLLGMKSGRPLDYQGDPRAPEGDPVVISVEWQDGGKSNKARIEDLVVNMKNKKPMARMNWVFTGSKIVEGRLMAQIERSLVAIFHDPAAIIDNPLPEGGDDTMWFVNTDKVPVPGTKASITIEAVKK
jgi:hypothetical protein